MPAARVLPPLPAPLAVASSPLHRMRALLVWGFGASIVVHAFLGPIAGRYKPPRADGTEVSIVSLSRRTSIKLPTPTPTPQPTPPPTPVPSPLARPSRPAAPLPVHAAPPAAHLKIDVYKATSHAKAPASAEAPYRTQSGSQLGVPQGTLASAPAIAAPATGFAPSAVAATPAEPTRAPCASANVEARVTKLTQAVYPESARDLGRTGDVDVLVSLSASGAVAAATIYHSSGSGALDQAALLAARESTYAPATIGCEPFAGTYMFHASFTLNDPQP